MSDQSKSGVLSGNHATGFASSTCEIEPMSDEHSAVSREDFGGQSESLSQFFAIHASLVKAGKVEMKPAEACREHDLRNIRTLRSAENFALTKIVGRSNSR